METGTLLIDIDRCIRCFACEVACKQENDLPPGPRAASVVTIEPRTINGELTMDFVFTTCLQCDDPLCRAVCPHGAILKRKDGIVLVDDNTCKGCSYCVYACPFGAIQINQEKRIAWKCSLCTDRLEHGLMPSCVQHCSGGSLQYVTPRELEKATEGRHKVYVGKVCYVSVQWKLVKP
jgi:Fe-S-cluster-containing dehydrogenase component